MITVEMKVNYDGGWRWVTVTAHAGPTVSASHSERVDKHYHFAPMVGTRVITDAVINAAITKAGKAAKKAALANLDALLAVND